MTIDKPWISGPRELLVHGIQHLDLNSGFDYRIAMISIDNSVELMIKTYLGLPKRITRIEGITRKKYEEITSTFPNLLDGVEEFASDKLNGIELGDIEWFHRLRNQLYHDGNGITVEKEKVEAYAEIAKILFENLFGIEIEESGNENLRHSLVGEFIKEWTNIEKLSQPKDTTKRMLPLQRFREMAENGELTKYQIQKLDEIRKFRNNLVHGMTSPTESELNSALNELKEIIKTLEKASA
ncbi:hypothetical protein [Flavivirga rizhaonensis]|uniref:Apea-like HEPN domain-containing protein n=1 Tax=Flavivirga rizhaonensis TaxID=2559571 RepID=A0A4S1DRV6_9FLAO|nr:hypothetical protein [Flavivirga rizhaonensis]TGV00453.1 hypothetical protein EM932_19655 [Flavivirga rizhaonensis]